jgi:hypothetical protein
MSSSDGDLMRRLDRLESYQAIQQLPIRYALAIDGRDIDAWVRLFVPDVHVTRETSGRRALAAQIEEKVRTFRRSIHSTGGHRIEFDESDDDHATGAVYCRAEHEDGERWMVMSLCYFDDYRRVEGEWLFRQRRARHWYSADINEHPQSVDFDSWHHGGPVSLPESFPTWAPFWDR